MNQNLKARLGRIRISDTRLSDRNSVRNSDRDSGRTGRSCAISDDFNAACWSGWTEAGYMTLKRKISRELSFRFPQNFPKALFILIPDIYRFGRIPSSDEMLFFDLETTGLSGGAGTVAFLAAFGRFVIPAKIEITQYLLLDYPGEADFIENLVKEFTASAQPKIVAPPLVLSYNGKSFDSQILKNRCLMNGIMPPVYFHADLLHPARRLWKQQLPDCSQATIEVSVLGLDRTGDVSGALAPEIWFSFLRSGDNHELLSVCDHNTRDIVGLASLFLALGEIAEKPLESRNRFKFDLDALALSWTDAHKRRPFCFDDNEREKGELLLKTAASAGCPRASVVMAKKAEWRLKDPALALAYTNSALAFPGLSEGLRNELEKRRGRLKEKIREYLS